MWRAVMSEFDIFFDEYENKHNCSPEKYECFEAGQQSQQAKIDELQGRIDGARSHVDHIYNVLGDDPDLAKLLDEMVEILKGNNSVKNNSIFSKMHGEIEKINESQQHNKKTIQRGGHKSENLENKIKRLELENKIINLF